MFVGAFPLSWIAVACKIIPALPLGILYMPRASRSAFVLGLGQGCVGMGIASPCSFRTETARSPVTQSLALTVAG